MRNYLALLPDDGPEFSVDPTTETPTGLARAQAHEAREFMEQLRASGGLRFPWTDLDRMIGPLLPGWLVMVGGRGKAGKTTMLMQLLTAWTELGKAVVYVGTETSASHLRYVWGATRLNVPIDVAIDPKCPTEIYERIMHDVEHIQTTASNAHLAIFADSPAATIPDLARWTRYGQEYSASAVIFDHFSRLEVGGGERWQGLGDAIRQIKQLAVSAKLTLVVGAQLTQGEGGSWLGEHEVPGNGSWAGTSNIQREMDAGIQLWRPFKSGVTGEQKRVAKEDMHKTADLIQHGVMGVRLAAHRWGKQPNTFCKLYVTDGQITGWSGL